MVVQLFPFAMRSEEAWPERKPTTTKQPRITTDLFTKQTAIENQTLPTPKPPDRPQTVAEELAKTTHPPNHPNHTPAEDLAKRKTSSKPPKPHTQKVVEELAKALFGCGLSQEALDELEAHAAFRPHATTLTHINMLAQVWGGVWHLAGRPRRQKSEQAFETKPKTSAKPASKSNPDPTPKPKPQHEPKPQFRTQNPKPQTHPPALPGPGWLLAKPNQSKTKSTPPKKTHHPSCTWTWPRVLPLKPIIQKATPKPQSPTRPSFTWTLGGTTPRGG
jgi:hypothetical protein